MNTQTVTPAPTPAVTKTPAPRATLLIDHNHARRLEFGYFTIELGDNPNPPRLNIYTERAPSHYKYDSLLLPIPGGLPRLYIAPDVSIDTLARCAGLGSYDCALPMQWVRKEFTDRGLAFPLGVWSYDRNRYGGEFVSLGDMLQIIAQSIVAMSLLFIIAPIKWGDLGNLPIDHNDFNRTKSPAPAKSEEQTQPPAGIVVGDILKSAHTPRRLMIVTSIEDRGIWARFEFERAPYWIAKEHLEHTPAGGWQIIDNKEEQTQ